MIPNWKYWLFISLILPIGMHAYHALYEFGLWRFVGMFFIGAVYAIFFDKYRKTIVEVDK